MGVQLVLPGVDLCRATVLGSGLGEARGGEPPREARPPAGANETTMPIEDSKDQLAVNSLIAIPGDTTTRRVVLGDGSMVQRTGAGPRVYFPPSSRDRDLAARVLAAIPRDGEGVPLLTAVRPKSGS